MSVVAGSTDPNTFVNSLASVLRERIRSFAIRQEKPQPKMNSDATDRFSSPAEWLPQENIEVISVLASYMHFKLQHYQGYTTHCSYWTTDMKMIDSLWPFLWW
jgi:hypothetical protein